MHGAVVSGFAKTGMGRSYPRLPTNHLTFSGFPNTEALVSSMCWYYSALHRIIMWKAREEELRVLSSQP